MRKFKYWFLGVGVFIVAAGFMSLPLCCVSPKRQTSSFNNLADTGAFLTPVTGLLLAFGIVLILIFFLIKDEN